MEVSLLNRLLNWETDNEFVIVLEDAEDESSEEVDDEAMEDDILDDLDSRGGDSLSVSLSTSLEVNPSFSNQILFFKSATDGRRTDSLSSLPSKTPWVVLSADKDVEEESIWLFWDLFKE